MQTSGPSGTGAPRCLNGRQSGRLIVIVFSLLCALAPNAHAQQYILNDLGNLGGSYGTVGAGINASGQVTGASYTTGNVGQDAFLYSGGAMQDLGTSAAIPASGLASTRVGR